MLACRRPTRRSHRGRGDGARRERELPGRQPGAAAARPLSPARHLWLRPPGRRAGRRAPGDRLAALDWLEQDLDRAFEGRAEHPLLARLQPTLRECALPREPFVRLIEANRVDQRVSRYETWEQLRGYCALSADPVGELVLGVLGMATPARIALSDSICTALQLTEHCQDVAEDSAAGASTCRPRTSPASAARPRTSPPSTPASRCGRCSPSRSRARELLAEGAPLIGELRGRARLAVAAFVAGGRAALDAIERAGYDVLAGPPRAGGARRLLALAARRSGGAGGAGVSTPGRAPPRPTRTASRSRARRPPTSTTASACCRARAPPRDVRGVRVRPPRRRHRRRHARARRRSCAGSTPRRAGARRARRLDAPPWSAPIR